MNSTKTTKRWMVIGLACAALIALFFVTSRKPPAPNETQQRVKITIATFSKALGNAPYHIAKKKGWFAEEPALKDAEVTFTEFNDRATIAQAFDRGDLQVLFSAEVPSMLCRAQGNDIRIVGVSTAANQEILVPVGSPIRSVPDIRGKKVAVLQGTSSHFCLLKILTQHGITVKDITLNYLPAAEARAAFVNNQLDAWAVWAPWVEEQEVKKTGTTITGGEARIVSVMTMSKAFLEKHADSALAVYRVIARSKRWIQENPTDAIDIAASDLGIDPAVAKQAWPKFAWGLQFETNLVTDFQEKADFLAAQGLTRQGAKLDVTGACVDFSLANRK